MSAPLRGDEGGTPLAADAEAEPGGSTFERMLRQTSAHNEEAYTQARGLSMEWQDLSWSINGKRILRGITGLMEPGHVTAVLGPSGSGKSSLLNILAGRQRTSGPAGSAPLTGRISVEGAAVDVSEFKSNIAYVMQDDSLMATETPRECINFSAYLRRPGPAAEREQMVSTMLSTLGLDKCADTIVGSALLKGISGGERKRTSVGVELITNPKMLFLDEPLSGLDSYAAFTLAKALKDLAAAGVGVLVTVHQPSSEIFAMFDDVVILHDGAAVYHGPTRLLAGYFDRWERCPANFNPADHVMFLLQTSDADRLVEMKAAWGESAIHKELEGRIDEIRLSPGASAGALPSFSRPLGGHRLNRCKQLAILTRRELRGTLRNKGVFAARIGMSLFLAALYSWLFAGSASNGDDPKTKQNCLGSVNGDFDTSACAASFQAHYGTLVSLSISSMMGSAQPILLSFPDERPVFLREYAAQQYGVVPYFVSKTLVELPFVLLCQLLTYLCAYWVMGLQGSIFELVGSAWALGIASSSLSLVIGCGVASAQKAMQLAPLALIPQMLFSGLFLPVAKIPSSLRWVQYLCPLKYAINLSTLSEFDYVQEAIEVCEAARPQQDCRMQVPGMYMREAAIINQGVHWGDWPRDLGILMALLVGFRIIASVLLWRKGKYVY